MPVHLRALVVVLLLAAVVFAIAKTPACGVATTPDDFKRRRNLWFGITLTAFLAHDFWIFMGVAAILLLFAMQREQNKPAMYFSVLFAVPVVIAEQISGLGIIQHFFTLNFARLLALAVLLPTFLHLRTRPTTDSFGKLASDKLLAAYLVLQLLLMLKASSFTNTLRHGMFYAFIDVFLPYYVASRSLRSVKDFRDTLMTFLVAALMLSAIGVFEWARHWLLYARLDDVWGVPVSYGSYLEREKGVLRAQATANQPIPLGYVIAVGLGLFLYIRKLVSSSRHQILIVVLLVLGLIAPLSRGPWVGAAAMAAVFVALSPAGARRIVQIGIVGVIALIGLYATDAGNEILRYLPFVGSVQSETIEFRRRLLLIAIQFILQNPFFGAFDYIYSPAFQELKTGSGLIDIVNTYVGIGLSSGITGLALFVGFFLSIIVGMLRTMRTLEDRASEHYLLGQVLFSVLLGVLVIIFTVSSISFVPLVYWALAGFGVAYIRMLAPARAYVPPPATAGTHPRAAGLGRVT